MNRDVGVDEQPHVVDDEEKGVQEGCDKCYKGGRSLCPGVCRVGHYITKTCLFKYIEIFTTKK